MFLFSNRRFFVQRLLAVALLWFIWALPAAGQLGTASINGTVRDSTDAIIPGTEIVLHNSRTGVDMTTVTNDDGIYAFVNVAPGIYNLNARKAGFRTEQENNITLNVDQDTSFDFVLKVGKITQTVTVESQGHRLETSTADLGVTISTREVTDLPLNGRNFSELLTLTPGVSGIDVSQNSAGSDISAIGNFNFPSVNGQENRSNMFLLDGLNDLEAVRNEYSVPPIIDDIYEFKVNSHDDQAEFGGTLGGTINVVTKSGTNRFHGAAWGFLRNSQFDARNPLTGLSELRQAQFGGNFGGPVLLPKTYNGRNHTFFFASYEGYRHLGAGSTFYVVPTAAELAGNFNALSTKLYNPFTTAPDPTHSGEYTRTIFAGNDISSALDTNMVNIAKAIFPAPIQTSLPNYNGLDTTPAIVHSNEYNIRGDEQISSHDSVWGRFMRIDTPGSGTGGFKGALAQTQFIAHVIGASWTHEFGSNVVGQIQFGRNDARDIQANLIENQNAQSFDQTNGLSPFFDCGLEHGPSGACMIPDFNISGYLSGGGNYVNRHLSSIWELRGDLKILRGRNLVSIGTDFNTNTFDEPIAVISEGFAASQTQNLESPAGTGNALASFLLGVPTSASRRALVETEQRGDEDAFYGEDQFKASDRITINFGLRYDLTLKPIYGRRSYGNQYVGDMDLSNGTYILAQVPTACVAGRSAPCIPGGTLPANVFVTDHSNGRILHNNYGNVQPRLGMVFRVQPQTVVRSSFGIVFDDWGGIAQQAQGYAGSWPSVSQISASNLNSSTVTATAENPLAQTSGLPAANPFGQNLYFVEPTLRTPYSEQWTLGLERQVGASVFALNYVGSHDVHLDLGEYGNTAAVPGAGNSAVVASRRPYPYISPTVYETDQGASSYNALEASATGRVRHGLSYLVAYTWSKSLDLGCSGFFGLEGCAIQNPYNLRADWAVSAFNQPTNFHAAWTYQLPFGVERWLRTGNKFVDYAIGGWAVNGILTFSSGEPYYTCISGDITNTGNSGNGSPGNCYERLNVVGDPNLAHPTIKQWFNKAAFAVPANYTFGDESRNYLSSDSYKDLDFSVFRDFLLPRGVDLQFRTEAFNVTNTQVWGVPDGNYNDATFGQVSSTRSTPRQIQFSLKLLF